MAGLRHASQVRKGTGAPYLVHLVHVASIVARAGYDEDTQITALLHDILEDTTEGPHDAARLAAHIRAEFGSTVANAVATLTEPKRTRDGHPLPWRLRKEQYLAQLAVGSLTAVRVSAADKLHNLATLAEALACRGETVWDQFKVGPDETFWFYRSVNEIIQSRCPDSIADALRRQMTHMGILDAS